MMIIIEKLNQVQVRRAVTTDFPALVSHFMSERFQESAVSFLPEN